MFNIARRQWGIIRDWVAAWRHRDANPLRHYWEQAEGRRWQRRVWWARSPGLLISAVLLSLAITAALVYVAWRVLELRAGAASGPYLSTQAILGTSLLAAAGALACFFLLLARLHTVAQLTLGFLECEPHRRLRQTLDDMLAVSRLSEQEVLMGLALHCLRIILPPLGTLSLFVLVGTVAYFVLGGQAEAPLALYYGQALLIPFKLFVSGILASLALIFMLVSLSLTPRAGLAPGMGAVSQVFLQIALLCGGIYAFFAGGQSELVEMRASYSFGTGVVVVLLLALLHYLARRLPWMRLALAYGYPLVLAGIAVVVLGAMMLSEGGVLIDNVAITMPLWGLQVLSVFNVMHFATDWLYLYEAAADVPLFHEWWRFPMFMLLQLAVVVIFAEFARDAIRRRKWGMGQE
jgi:hypothetical protein